MTDREKRLTWFVAALAALIMGFLIIAPATAGHRHNTTINNYYVTEEVTEVYEVTEVLTDNSMTITNGITADDLAKGMAVAMAAGGHQFDFSTSDWQGSIVGSWQLSDEKENAASFALGKRFKESFMPNALLHVTYTPNGDDDWLMVGGTFRF